MEDGKVCETVNNECASHFKAIHDGIADLKKDIGDTRKECQDVSDRLFKTNGKRALVTVIEDNTKAHAELAEKVDNHLADISGPKKTVKRLTIGRNGLDSEGYSGQDLLKVIIGVAILLYMVGRDLGPQVLQKIFGGQNIEAHHDAP